MNLILLFQEDFIDENKVSLKGRRLNHVLSVHRAQLGDTLKIGIVNGKIGTGLITSLTTDALEMEVKLTDAPPKPSNIQIILAMTRPKVFKRVLQDLTTMGVKKIFVIKTWRVDKSYWGSSYLNNEALLKHMILGLEQGKDTILPEVHIKKLFKPFVEDEIPDIIRGTKAIVAHPTSNKECPYNLKEPITLAIGPEGGFIPYEVEMLKNQGFEIVNLGDRILRTETVIPYLIGRLS